MSSDLSWGQRIRNLQEKFGCTTAQLSLKLRISEGSVYALLRHPKRIPSKIVQEEIEKLEKGIDTVPPITAGSLQELKQGLIASINRNKPTIYEADISDEEKIKFLRFLKDFIADLEKFGF